MTSRSTLSADTDLTRQAVTKHLRVPEQAGLFGSVRVGRESRFALSAGGGGGGQIVPRRHLRTAEESLGELRALVQS